MNYVAKTVHDYAAILQPALDQAGGSHTLHDVADDVAEGRMQFWPGINSAIVTQLEGTPRRKFVHFFLAGGTLEELEAMLPHILEWAKGEGCDGATLFGRAGWQRAFLTKIGWQPQGVIMGVDFSGATV